MMACCTEALHECLTTTGVKAIPRVVKAKTTYHRILWISAFLLGLGIGAYFSHSLLRSYFSHAKIIVTQPLSNATKFPDITLCRSSPLASLHLDDENIHPLQSEKGWQSVPWEDEIQHWKYYGHHVPEPVLLENIIMAPNFSSKMLMPMIVAQEWVNKEEQQITPVSYPKANLFYSKSGFCTTLRPPEDGNYIHELNAIIHVGDPTVDLNPSMSLSGYQTVFSGVVLSAHVTGSLPYMPKPVTIPAGFFGIVTLKQEMIKRLPAPFTGCKTNAFWNETQAVRSVNSETDTQTQSGDFMINTSAYKSNVCRDWCIQLAVIEECQCVS